MSTDHSIPVDTEWHSIIRNLNAAAEGTGNSIFQRAVLRLSVLKEEHIRDMEPEIEMNLLSTLARGLMTCISTKEIERPFVQLLPDVLRISGSQFGFLAEVCYNSRREPYLKSHAVTNIYKPNFGRYDIVSGLQFHNLETLNGAIMTSRRPVLTNEPQTDPRSGGLPFDHFRVKAFLGLPFLVDDDLVGAVALADRPGGYSETEVQLLAPLCEIGGLMIAACRS